MWDSRLAAMETEWAAVLTLLGLLRQQTLCIACLVKDTPATTEPWLSGYCAGPFRPAEPHLRLTQGIAPSSVIKDISRAKHCSGMEQLLPCSSGPHRRASRAA